jgi:prephenate dehydratase
MYIHGQRAMHTAPVIRVPEAPMRTIAFLGPSGTNTEEALLELDMDELEPIPCPTIDDVFAAVADTTAEFGIVPIENSVEGSVNATLDALAFDYDLHIVGEHVMDIHHMLVAAPGVGLEDVTLVTSHPQATAQSRHTLTKLLPGRPIVAANSTAEAVQRAVAEPGVAAVGSSLAARLYGATILAEAVEDHPGNQTRFVVIGRGIGEKTGDDKTSLALFMQQNKPGALLMILSEFAYGQIDLTKIQSRPTKKQLGEYMFFVDVRGHVGDPDIELALACLKLKLRDAKLLGSYPAAKS